MVHEHGWRCVMVFYEDVAALRRQHKPIPPGWMWLAPWYAAPENATLLSPEYLHTWKDLRPPVSVMLPGESEWVIDWKADGQPNGWVVNGQPPNITVLPSVVTERYHGFLTGGYLSHDLEGRKYDEATGALLSAQG